MKNVFILSSALTTMLFLAGCDGCVKNANKKGASCQDCSIKETYGHTFSDFEDVVDRYKTERWDIINQAFANGSITLDIQQDEIKRLEDSRSVWFSLDSLKQFICTIEKYSANLGMNDSLGIRMYYAVYPSAKKKFPLRHTIFMVPTFKKAGTDAGTTGIDFDPRYNWQNRGKDKVAATSSISILKGKSNEALILGGDNNDPQMRGNDGDLCPPCSKGCIHNILDNN